MKINKEISQILLAAIISLFIIQMFFKGQRKFDEMALGSETVPYYAKDTASGSIHIDKINKQDADKLLNAHRQRGGHDVIFFLGNSQTHSINQMQPREENYIKILFDTLSQSGSDVICHSMPNANMQELYLSYMYWKDKLPIKMLVIPLFYDDFRENGIRGLYFQHLLSSRFVLNDSVLGANRNINRALASQWIDYANINAAGKEESPENKALEGTVQEEVENKLNNFLTRNTDVWQNRSNLRGDFFVWLYKLRNTVMGIRPSTIRHMIPQSYTENMSALELLLDDCEKNNKEVLVYIPPVRSDTLLPYDMKAYKAFKLTVKDICSRNSRLFHFAELDTIVPGPLWGLKESTNFIDKTELDYMHFKYDGHKILADSLHYYIHLSTLE